MNNKIVDLPIKPAATPQRWKLALRKLFRSHPVAPELPKWAADGVITTTLIEFPLKDRLMAALTGRISVRTYTACQKISGRVDTTSHAMPAPPQFLDL